MIIAISLFTIVALLFSSVYYRQETSRLENECKRLINQRNFAQADADNFQNSLNVAYGYIDELENKFIFTYESITELDDSLLKDETDPTRAEYWDGACEDDALASGYHYDDDGQLVQTHTEFVSDISDAIDSIKWTSQDGE